MRSEPWSGLEYTMKRIYPLNDLISSTPVITLPTANAKNLSPIEKQVSPSALRPNISVESRQIARSKLKEKSLDIVGNIATGNEYPVNSNNTDNAELDNNLNIREQVPKKRSMVSENENNSSHNQNIAENNENSSIALALQKRHHERVATIRTNTFRAILSNEFEVTLFQWMKYVSYIFVTITIASSMTFFFTI